MPVFKTKPIAIDSDVHIAYALGVADAVYARFGCDAVIIGLRSNSSVLETMGVPPESLKLIIEELRRRLESFGFLIARDSQKKLHIVHEPTPGKSFWKYIAKEIQ